MNFDSRDYIERARENRGGPPEEYAGALVRFVASFVDGLILAIPLSIVFTAVIVIGVFASAASSDTRYASSATSGVVTCLICLMYPAILIAMLLYNAGFESSRYMATPGKMLLGIKVTDLDGNRISFGKALLRALCKFILNNFFYIGSLFILISEKKQGLYDVVAGTLVVKNN